MADQGGVQPGAGAVMDAAAIQALVQCIIGTSAQRSTKHQLTENSLFILSYRAKQQFAEPEDDSPALSLNKKPRTQSIIRNLTIRKLVRVTMMEILATIIRN